jgi:phosphatidylglycerophosphatase C
MILYLFDFDGTITTKDSMIEYIKVVHNNVFVFLFYNFLFIPFFILYKLKMLKKQFTKEIYLKIHLRSYREEFLRKKSIVFSKKIKTNFFSKFKSYNNNAKGEKCIVSASLDLWMNDIANELEFKLICTQSNFKNNKFIGINKNCFGNEKVRRINENYNLNEFKEIYIFGDSEGDRQMFNLGKKHYKFFNN